MLTYKGGHAVGRGTYWDLASGRRIDVFSEAILAGGGTVTYVRMPSVVMLLSGTVNGLLYAILMPFISIATVAALSVRVGLGALYHMAANSVSFGWRPQNAYLAGKKNKNVTK
jgi:hypothetical protein